MCRGEGLWSCRTLRCATNLCPFNQQSLKLRPGYVKRPDTRHQSSTVNLRNYRLATLLRIFGAVTPAYLLTPLCRVLLEKLNGLQLVKKFAAFHRTRRFITALTSVRQLSLSWASPIQSIYPHPTSWRSILILSTHLSLGLPSGLLPSGLHTYLLHGAESFLRS